MGVQSKKSYRKHLLIDSTLYPDVYSTKSHPMISYPMYSTRHSGRKKYARSYWIDIVPSDSTRK